MKKLSLKRLLSVIMIICLLILSKKELSSSFAFNSNIESKLEIYFLDVGQADSILIKQDDKSVVIDAGNNEDGEYIVDFLKKDIGLDNIDLLVGTHPHEDHIGGLDNIIESFDIENIYMPDAISTSKTFEEVIDAIEKKNYSITIPKINSEVKLGDMLFNVLYVGNEEDDLNNTSIVLRLDFGNTSYLFTGDATSEVEELILDKNISVDVLKVGHHGSRYSTTNEFLNKVNPKYAIIMVGRDNSYGHPTKETINKLEKNNVKIFRTDEDGTIKLVSDGNKIDFELLDVNLNG